MPMTIHYLKLYGSMIGDVAHEMWIDDYKLYDREPVIISFDEKLDIERALLPPQKVSVWFNN